MFKKIALFSVISILAGCNTTDTMYNINKKSPQVCENTVNIEYSHKNYEIVNQDNPNKSFWKQRGIVLQDESERHKRKALAYTKMTKFHTTLDVQDKRNSCGKNITLTWVWENPIVIVLPPKSSTSHCRYNAMLQHEMTHVKLFLETPHDYDDAIKTVLTTSKNIQSDTSRLVNEVTKIVYDVNRDFDKHDTPNVFKECR